MYTIDTTNKFDKDFKLCQKRGLPMDELKKVITLLSESGSLPQIYKPHKLHGNLEGVWECHIKSDWLLTWLQNDKELKLLLLRTGSHSDLF